MLKVLLDPGHGAGRAHNRGAVCYNEGDNNFHYCMVLKEELEKYADIKVDMTRKRITDDPTLAQRAAMANGYDVFWSQHSNAGGGGRARGTEVWDNVSNPNKPLAAKISAETANLFGHNDRGVRYRKNERGYNWYGVLRNNRAKTSMIIENGFHDNRQDCQFFKNNHRLIAQTQARVLANHYGLSLKKQETSKPIKTPSDWSKKDWEWSEKEGFLDGNRPREEMTREEFAVVIKRMVDSQ